MRVLSPITRIPSREGRLLITSDHVSFSGASSWDVPRAAVSGVSVSAGLVIADLLITTLSGQRYPIPGVLFRDALVAIDLLGYLPSPTSPPPTKPLPLLSIPTNYTPGRLVITEQVVRLEGRTAWEVARVDVRGVSIEPGALTVRLFVHTRDGHILCADHLPFNGALRAIEALGCLPRESAPPAPVPDLAFPPLPPLSPRPISPRPPVATRPLPPLPRLDIVPLDVVPLDVVPRPAPRATPRTIPLAKSQGTGQLPAVRPPAPASQPAVASLTPLAMLASILLLLQGLPRAQRRFLARLAALRGSMAIASRTIPHLAAGSLRSLRSLPARVLAHAPVHELVRAVNRSLARADGLRGHGFALRRVLTAWPQRAGTRLFRSAVALARDSRRMVSIACLLFLAALLSVGVIADHQLVPGQGAMTRHTAQPTAAPHPASPTVAPPAATATATPIPPPVLAVFAGSHDGSLYALRASDGALLWRYKTGGQIESAPALADSIVYAGSDDGTIYALRSQDDTIVWRYRTGDKVVGSPAVANGIVYIGSNDGYFYALHASDGALLWRYKAGNWIVGQPAVVNGVVYIGSYDDYLYALRASDGALLWRYATRGAVVSSPTISDGMVYVGSADNSLYVLRASDGTLLWRRATSGSLLSSPVVANGIVYISSLDGALYAFHTSNGALHWRYTTGGQMRSSPVISGGTIYIGSNDGSLYALRADDGALLWLYKTGGAVITTPDVAQGVVYIGSADHNVYALRASDGTRIWSFTTGDVIGPRLAVGL